MRDIVCVVNAHREGALMIPTIRAVALAQAHAEAQGVDCGVCVILDATDDMTRETVADEAPDGWQVEETAERDLGGARNRSVELAEPSRNIAFMDADDLCSRNWLAAGSRCADAGGPGTVWHPSANLVFGAGDTYVYRHRDMDDPKFSLAYLLLDNYWTALSLADRAVYRDHPYSRNRLDEGWGYEDWTWNAATIARGIRHKVVPQTAHFIRRKARSLLSETKSARAMPRLGTLRDRLLTDDA